MRGHNICFLREIRKIIFELFQYSLLSEALMPACYSWSYNFWSLLSKQWSCLLLSDGSFPTQNFDDSLMAIIQTVIVYAFSDVVNEPSVFK